MPPADKLCHTANSSPVIPIPTPATPDHSMSPLKFRTNTCTPAAGATRMAIDRIEPTAGIATTMLAHNNPSVIPSMTANHQREFRTATRNATGSK